jgi:sugar phosphate isomerase/epimerase
MPPLQIAIATSSLSQPLKQAVQTAARLGATGLQIDARNELRPSALGETGRRQFLHQLSELGLQVTSLTFPVRRSLYDEDELEARVDATKQALDFAYQLGAKVVTARIGKIPTDRESREYDLLRDVLDDLARHGNRVGATLAISSLGDAPTELAGLLEDITQGPLGLDFDPAGFAMAAHNPVAAFRALHNSVMHVRVRDGLRHIDVTGVEVAVGQGDVDWPQCLALLDEAHYTGWLTVDRTAGDTKTADVTHAVEFLRSLAPHT